MGGDIGKDPRASEERNQGSCAWELELVRGLSVARVRASQLGYGSANKTVVVPVFLF